MVSLESCKGCGSSTFDVVDKKGFRFLVCTHCGNDVALLSDKDLPYNRSPFVPYTGYNMDFKIMSSGIMYSGMVNYDAVISKDT